MAIERTLSIIKPDATKRNLTGKINAKFEEAGLRVVASKRIHLTMAQAGAFYAEHKERGFYGELCAFMASEPVVVQVLEGEGAIAKNREVMGATDPANAADGTIRKEFALSRAKTRSTGRTARHRPRARSPSSSRVLNWSADPKACDLRRRSTTPRYQGPLPFRCGLFLAGRP
jgi:nucleoside-diphosphate kinase